MCSVAASGANAILGSRQYYSSKSKGRNEMAVSVFLINAVLPDLPTQNQKYKYSNGVWTLFMVKGRQNNYLNIQTCKQ